MCRALERIKKNKDEGIIPASESGKKGNFSGTTAHINPDFARTGTIQLSLVDNDGTRKQYSKAGYVEASFLHPRGLTDAQAANMPLLLQPIELSSCGLAQLSAAEKSTNKDQHADVLL